MKDHNFQLGNSVLIVGSDQADREKKAEELTGINLLSLTNDPDVFLLRAEKSIGIEEVRNLQKNLSLRPFAREKKIAFINEAQNLTPEAQNALLKTLEEPSAHCLIILSSPDPAWLLPTVVSRCQIFFLPGKTKALSEEERKESLAFLNKILSATIPERFLLLEEAKISKDRETAENWLNKNTIVLRETLLSLVKDKPYPLKDIKEREKFFTYHNLLSSFVKLRKYLQANCNVRLSLEVFLLEIKT